MCWGVLSDSWLRGARVVSGRIVGRGQRLGGLPRFGTEMELGVQGAGFGTVLGLEEQHGSELL